LNQKMRKQLNENGMADGGRQTDLVITNLPDLADDVSSFGYMQYVEHLTAGLPRTLLIRGTSREVISAFT
jgi:hypothetical protein